MTRPKPASALGMLGARSALATGQTGAMNQRFDTW